MFIFNIKLNGKLLFKIFISIVIIMIILMFGLACYKVFDESIKANDSTKNYNVISQKNYTNILKSVHDKPDDYIGQKVTFSGFIYRLIDFTENEFVVARNMIVSSDFQTVVVGFLCRFDDAKKFEDNSWVEVNRHYKKRNISWRDSYN